MVLFGFVCSREGRQLMQAFRAGLTVAVVGLLLIGSEARAAGLSQADQEALAPLLDRRYGPQAS